MFAIVITLLVLELKVPHVRGDALLAELSRQGPAFLAFITGFVTVAIMWLNHHRVFTLIRRIDHGLMLWNALLLLGVTLVPYFTHLIAISLGHPGDRIAAVLYSANGLLVAIGYNGMWRHITSPRRTRALLGVPHDDLRVIAITQAYRFGPLIYFVAFLIAFANAWLSTAVNLGLALFFAMPPGPLPATDPQRTR